MKDPEPYFLTAFLESTPEAFFLRVWEAFR